MEESGSKSEPSGEKLTPLAKSPISITPVSTETVPLPRRTTMPTVSFGASSRPTVPPPRVQVPGRVEIPPRTPPRVPSQTPVPPRIPIPPRTFSTFLSDNAQGNFVWLQPNPPSPVDPTNVYRRIGCIGDGSCFFHAVGKALSTLYQLSYRPFNTIDRSTLQQYIQYLPFPSNLFAESISGGLKAELYHITNHRAFATQLNQFRRQFAILFRRDFANRIQTDTRMQNLIFQYLSGSIEVKSLNYRMIWVGNVAQINPRVSEVEALERGYEDTKTDLINQLNSDRSVPPDFLPLLSDYLEIDIYLVRDADLQDTSGRTGILYGGTSLHQAVRGPRNMRRPGSLHMNESERNAIVIIAVNDNHYELICRIDGQGNIILIFPPDEPLIRRLYHEIAVRT